MMQQPRLGFNELASLKGRPVYSSDGETIGSVDTIYYDETTRVPEWLGVNTQSGFLESLFGGKHVLVPVFGASIQGQDSIRVPYAKDQVKGAPAVDMDTEEISEEEERRVYAHYGLQPSERRSESQLPESGQTPTMREHLPQTGWTAEPAAHDQGRAEMTRREEELRIGKQESVRSHIRLRRWVQTEPVTAEVELRQEKARIEREPINRPAPGAQLGEQEADITLRGEEPVVEKEVVEKERIIVTPEEETHRETVHGEVRKEHIQVEGQEGNLEDEEEEDKGTKAA
jgi:stress response protein YsnF